MPAIDTSTNALLADLRDGAATVTLDKPHKRNALVDVPALRAILLTLEDDPACGAIIDEAGARHGGDGGPFRECLDMNYICGIRSRGDAHGLAAVLAELGPAAHGGEWAAAGTGVGLGFRRIPAAPDIKALHFDREADLAAVVDVRLDDRSGLCDALGVRPCERAGLADGALVLRGYRRWGRNLPNHLLGDYAFAVWDAGKRTLFCARDPAGVKPCYYAATAQGFVFASTVDAVLAAPGVSGELDEAVVARSLTRAGLEDTGHTFFKQVRKLPPGHSLTLANGVSSSPPVVQLERYWRPEHVPVVRRASDDDYAEEFLDLFAQAVGARLHGADPIGTHLSGGLDSSSIAVLAARELQRQGRPAPLAFSWLPQPGGEPPSETHAAEYDLVDAVCRQEGLRVFHRSPSAEDLVDLLRLDGARPGTHVLISEDVVQRCAQEQGVRVLLSGWGGDQGVSFTGHGHHAQLLLSGRWSELATAARMRGKAPFRFLAGVALPLVHPRLPLELRWRTFGYEPWRRRWLVDPALARRTKAKPKRRPRLVGMRRAMLWLLHNSTIDERIEGWAAGGARRGIEYRYPLLDRRLLEFALSLPPEQFLRGKWNRWLMRHALRDVLPPSILWNPCKHDPARYDPLFNAFAEALPLVRRRLEARDVPPSRARYIDMPRLIELLDTARFRAEPRFTAIHRALQFLDF